MTKNPMQIKVISDQLKRNTSFSLRHMVLRCERALKFKVWVANGKFSYANQRKSKEMNDQREGNMWFILLTKPHGFEMWESTQIQNLSGERHIWRVIGWCIQYDSTILLCLRSGQWTHGKCVCMRCEIQKQHWVCVCFSFHAPDWTL